MPTLVVARQQFTLEGELLTQHKFQWGPGEFAQAREKAEFIKCHLCDKRISKRKAKGVDFFSPWSPFDQVEGDYTWYLCESCYEDGYYGYSDFGPVCQPARLARTTRSNAGSSGGASSRARVTRKML